MIVAQATRVNTPVTLTQRHHLDLAKLDLTTEDLLIRAGVRAVSRPPARNAERLAGIAARLEREAGR
jgi:hypothetical protein